MHAWVLFVCSFKFKSFDQYNPPEPPQFLDIYSIVVLYSLPCNRHSIQGGGISSPHVNYTVLQLPMFRTLSKNVQVKIEMSDLRRESLAQRMSE